MTHHDQICADTLSSPTTSDKNPFVFCCSPYKNGCTSWCTCCQHAIQTPFPKIQKLSRGKIMHAAMKPNIHTYFICTPSHFFLAPPDIAQKMRNHTVRKVPCFWGERIFCPADCGVGLLKGGRVCKNWKSLCDVCRVGGYPSHSSCFVVLILSLF